MRYLVGPFFGYQAFQNKRIDFVGIYGEIRSTFPTHVGMNRQARVSTKNIAYVPHTRGDEPTRIEEHRARLARSPHTWG